MSVEAGQSLSHYRLIEKIGEGGMGSVWKALDARLDREVALKILPSRVAGDPRALARFEREARAVAALTHPHILAVHDVGHEDGIHFVVMELLEGETLRQRLAEGPLPLRKTVEFAAQIARGLAAAHDKGIVHRDLKPDNVFVTRDGQVKILDFGLAKLEPAPRGTALDTEVATVTRHTDPGVVLGTVGYMSPEQVRGQEADGRSDIFALGVVLYEMVTGKRAFSCDSSVETMTAILKEEPADLQEISREVSPALERIIRHCLEKRPEERFQSARDVAFDLEAHTDPSSAGSVEAIDPAPSKSWVRTLARLAGAVLLAGGALAVGLLLGKCDRSSGLHKSERITHREGTVFRARFVGDGGTVVFSAMWNGEPQRLFVKRPEDMVATPLDLEAGRLLSVSPSGELAILTDTFWLPWFPGTLARAALSDSEPRELIEGVYDADWSLDGERLVIVREIEGKRRLEFPPGTTLYETAGHVSHPRFSPNGDRIAYLDHPSLGDSRGSVAVVDLQGNRETLSESWPDLQALAWSPSGDEVWFAPEPGSGLIAVTLDGGQRAVARPLTADTQILDLSPGGKALLARQDLRFILRGLGPGETGERNLSWLRRSLPRSISADGSTLLFEEQAEAIGPNYAVALRRMDGSTPVMLGEGSARSLSPDGRWALAIRPDMRDRFILLPTGAGEPRTVYVPGLQQALFFSADSDGVVVWVQEEGKAPRSYTVGLDGNDLRPLLPDGHTVIALPMNGRWIACYNHGQEPLPQFVFQDPGRFEMHSSDGREVRPILGLRPGELPFRWSADGRSMYVIQRTASGGNLVLVNHETGERALWKELTPPDRTGFLAIMTLAVNPEGTAYAYAYARELSELFVVEGLR